MPATPSAPYRGEHTWEIFEVLAPARLADSLPLPLRPGVPDPRPPRGAATVVLLRDGGDGLQVWLMERRSALVFGGMWVFPGGKVDPIDHEQPDPLVACAIREVTEEAWLTLTPDDLVPWSRWITPAELPVRFDTHFYLTALPAGVEPEDHSGESVSAAWFDLHTLLSADPDDPHRPQLMSPTRTVLWELELLGSWAAILTAAASRTIEPVLARWEPDGDRWRISHPRRDGSWT